MVEAFSPQGMNMQLCHSSSWRGRGESEWEEAEVWPMKKKHNLIDTQKDKRSVKVLNFEIQQVAVDFVVDVRIIFLLAQVQAWDVHCRLERKHKKQDISGCEQPMQYLCVCVSYNETLHQIQFALTIQMLGKKIHGMEPTQLHQMCYLPVPRFDQMKL